MSMENKMADFIQPKWLKRARITNFVLLFCAIIIALFVDGNGRIFGFGEKVSYIIGVLFFSPGILLSTMLTIIDKGHRITALLFLIVYILLGPWDIQELICWITAL